MESNSEIRRELHRIYRARVPDSFASSRHCLTYARIARRDGDSVELRKWIRCVRVLRMAAARWRQRARSIAPALICLVCFLHGCTKAPGRDAPSREFTVNFEVQPSPDGQSIVWSLQFKSREQYHAFLETTGDGADRAKVRELIAAGMQLHHIVGCNAHERTVMKLGDDGIAFVGSCAVNPAHATPAGASN
jgi:hypothetical protein